MTFGVDAISHGTGHTGGGGGGDGTLGTTWAHTCGAGANKLVVGAGSGCSAPGLGIAGNPASGITYNGVALTRIAGPRNDGFEVAEIWRLNNPPTGLSLNIVTAYPDPGANTLQMSSGGISFIDAAAAEGTPSTQGSLSTANPSLTVVDSAAGDIVLGMLATDLGPDGPTTENQTLIFEDEDVNADSDFSFQRTNAVGANTVVSWTSILVGGGSWNIVGISIKAASSAFKPDYSRFPIKKVADAYTSNSTGTLQ